MTTLWERYWPPSFIWWTWAHRGSWSQLPLIPPLQGSWAGILCSRTCPIIFWSIQVFIGTLGPLSRLVASFVGADVFTHCRSSQVTLGTNVKVFNTYRREGKAGRSHFLNHKPWGMRLMPGKAALVGLCLWGSLVPSWVPLPNTQVLVLPRPSDPPCAPHSPLGSIRNLCFHPLDRLVFHRANVFNFDEVSFIKFFFFSFMDCAFMSCPKTLHQALGPEDLLLRFLLKVWELAVLHSSLWSILFFVSDLRLRLRFMCLPIGIQFVRRHRLKRLSSFHWPTFTPLWKISWPQFCESLHGSSALLRWSVCPSSAVAQSWTP